MSLLFAYSSDSRHNVRLFKKEQALRPSKQEAVTMSEFKCNLSFFGAFDYNDITSQQVRWLDVARRL
jgi:hypothetical protein